MVELNRAQFDSLVNAIGYDKPQRQTEGWGAHALSERPDSETEKEPGRKWGRHVALVPVHQLARYREFDRTGQQARHDSDKTISNIAEDLKAGGVDAIKSPLHLAYNHDLKWGHLGEGHHRLEAAIQAGITHLPVQVYRSSAMSPGRKSTGQGAPLHMDERLYEDRHDYCPADIHPGNFQEFEGAR